MSALLQAVPQSGQRSMIRGAPGPPGPPPRPSPTVSLASPNGARVGKKFGVSIQDCRYVSPSANVWAIWYEPTRPAISTEPLVVQIPLQPKGWQVALTGSKQPFLLALLHGAPLSLHKPVTMLTLPT